MKILGTYIAAATQIHTGKCWFIGMSTDTSKVVDVYNVEDSGSIATTNKIAWIDQLPAILMLPLPGIECSNGLYVVPNDNKPTLVFWSIG